MPTARSYLDHASTSPLRPVALAATTDVLVRASNGELGDPARLHREGLVARALLEDARDRVATWLEVRPRQVVFTSGATESIAAAVFGARAVRPDTPLVVASPVEHAAVRRWTERGPMAEPGVDHHGRVDAEAIGELATDRAALVNLQWANHEVATRQPVPEVVETCGRRGVLVHVDAAQALTEAPLAVATGADLVSISGHKLGAPPGTGVLVVRRGLRIPPLMVGGDQERARRAGLEDIAALVGLAAVAEHLADHGREEADRTGVLTGRVRDWARATDGVEVLGHPEDHVPHLVCLGLRGIEPQPVLLGLDQRGVAVHSGSSCSSEAFEPSPVLEAMGVDAQRSLRISVGWSTSDADVDRAIAALEDVLLELRSLRVGP